MPDPAPDFEALLLALVIPKIEIIVVGGVCAVLHGAPVSTFDLDLVYSREAQNLAKLETVLRQTGAVYREKPSVSPDAGRLDGPGHHLLMTKYGPVDLLGSTVEDQGFPELLPHTEEVDLGGGLRVRILDLPTLIRLKEQLGRERDKAMLPLLRRTLREHGQMRDGPSAS